MSRRVPKAFLIGLMLTSVSCGIVNGQTVGPNADDLTKSRQKAINFLKTSQSADGYWTSPDAPGVSGLVVYSLLLSGVPASDPVVAKGLKHLESFTQPDGGIYSSKGNHGNYETAIILMAFQQANKDGK